MIDLAQCHWVVDEQYRLFLASAPSLRAPFRFDCFITWKHSPRRLSAEEAEAICQASIECGMRPMTFINSGIGIQFIQDMMRQEEVEQPRVA